LFETNSIQPEPRKPFFLSFTPLNFGNAVAGGRGIRLERGSCSTSKTDKGENWD
jgi:hypothetical protein